MTVIRPNSVAGINSITVQSGNSLAVHKANGELIRTITSNTGVSTFSSISVGTATTDNSAAKSINIGLGASISQHVDNSLSFGTGGTERVKITSSGNLEMPNDNDYIKIGAGADLQFVHTGSASVINNQTGFLEIQSDGTTFELADGTEKARFDSSGRLLIGTVTEGHTNADDLTVATSANTGITIRSGATSGGNIFFSDDTSGTGEYAGMISYDHNDNIMTFATNDGTERLRITSDGYVQINADTAFLQIGASQDLDLHHNGTNSYIRNKTGDLHIRPLVAEEGIILKPNGSAEIYYDNERKFRTVSDGVEVNAVEGGSANLALIADEGDDNADYWRLSGSSDGSLYIQNYTSGSWEKNLKATGNAGVDLYHDNVKKLETASHGITVSGEIRDDRGNIRDIQSEPLSGTHSSRTLVAADAGKVVQMSGGLTLPAASQGGPFGGGSTLTILNKSGSGITLTQGTGLTLYNTADATTGNRTLAARGIATVYYMYGGNEAYISGSGLS